MTLLFLLCYAVSSSLSSRLCLCLCVREPERDRGQLWSCSIIRLSIRKMALMLFKRAKGVGWGQTDSCTQGSAGMQSGPWHQAQGHCLGEADSWRGFGSGALSLSGIHTHTHTCHLCSRHCTQAVLVCDTTSFSIDLMPSKYRASVADADTISDTTTDPLLLPYKGSLLKSKCSMFNLSR